MSDETRTESMEGVFPSVSQEVASPPVLEHPAYNDPHLPTSAIDTISVEPEKEPILNKAAVLERLQTINNEDGILGATMLIREYLHTGGTLDELRSQFSIDTGIDPEKETQNLPDLTVAIQNEIQRLAIIDTITTVAANPNSSKESIHNLLKDYKNTYHEDESISKSLEAITNQGQRQKIKDAEDEIRSEQRIQQIEEYASVANTLLRDPQLRETLTKQLNILENPATQEMLEQYGVPKEDWDIVISIIKKTLQDESSNSASEDNEELEKPERMTGKKILGFGILLLADVGFNRGYGTQQLLGRVMGDKLLFPMFKKLGFSDKLISDIRAEGFSEYSANGELLRLPSRQLSEIILTLRSEQISNIIRSIPTKSERMLFATQGVYRNQKLSTDAVNTIQKSLSQRDAQLYGIERE